MARPERTNARARQRGSATRGQPALSQTPLTMQQEARNTERHSLWWSDTSLRYNKINFISAGDMKLDDPNDTDLREVNRGIREQHSTTESDTKRPEDAQKHIQTASDSLFLVDSHGEKIITDTGFADPIPRLYSPTTEDSSEDEVVFPGRNVARNRSICVDDQPQHALHSDATKNQYIVSGLTVRDEPDYGSTREPSPEPVDLREKSPSTIETANPLSASSRAKSHPTDEVIEVNMKLSRRKRRSRKAALDEAEIMADYIANMDKDYSYIEEWAGLTDEIHIDDAGSSSGDSNIPDDLSVPEGLPLKTGHTFSVGKGKTADRTRWRPGKPQTLPGADEQIKASDENGNLDIVCSDSSEISTSTSTDGDLNELEDFDPEQCEQALASADALEDDPYYGFDIMDFDRPSLRKKPKGRRKALNLELSDSELELELERAWQNDRRKKKTKRREREELRSQGLLGRRSGKVDMKAKYPEGMSIDDLKMEIRNFLLSSIESLPLPPMTKKDRKLVHDLANALSLKSQSRGSGSSRFPVLYKTSRTPKYTHKSISDIEKIFSRGRFNRPIGTSRDDRNPSRLAKNRRGRRNAAVSYMDGDIVGASAPEIGAENKGRAMLEKMGWITGTALGASNNKGILQPVVHVVKRSRAGLG